MRTRKRMVSLAITLLVVIACNVLISKASGIANIPDAPKPVVTE